MYFDSAFFRWVENKKTTARLIDVWENLKKLFIFWNTLTKSKRPKSKSYDTLKLALEDNFILPKLNFFAYVASIVEPFLKKYQTDNPMVPFLFYDLKSVIKRLLEIVVKQEVLEKSTSWKKMKAIDLSSKNNLLSDEKVNAGFAVTEQLNLLKRKDLVTSSEVKQFLNSAKQFVISMVEKLAEKSPLNFALVRASSIFDPNILLELPKQNLVDRLKALLTTLMNLKILTPPQCDIVLSQFKEFNDKEIKAIKKESFKFDYQNDRLDDFYFQKACVKDYKELSFVIRLVLTLSHGQAAVERGFSLNNSSVKTNMTPLSIISRRIVKDHLIANNLKPHTLEITSQLIKDFRSAHQKYVNQLKEEKKNKQKTEAEQQAMHIASDIEKLQQKIKIAEKAVTMMEVEVSECMELAEKKSDLSFVKKGNGLKRKSTETKQEIELLGKQIEELQKKKKELLTSLPK